MYYEKDLTINGLNSKTSVSKPTGVTFGYFKTKALAYHEYFKTQAEQTQKEIQNIMRLYSKDEAARRIGELKAKNEADFREKKSELNNMVSDICKAKKQNLEDFVSAVPSADVVNLLNLLNLRPMISKNGRQEWSVPTSELTLIYNKCKSNYQALKTFQGICNGHEISFGSIYDIDEMLNNIDKVKRLADSVILDVATNDKELGFQSFSFYKCGDNDYLTELFGALDSEIMVNTEEPTFTNLQKLEAAQEKATPGQALQIERFVKENLSDLTTEEDLARMRTEKAELISNKTDRFLNDLKENE